MESVISKSRQPTTGPPVLQGVDKKKIKSARLKAIYRPTLYKEHVHEMTSTAWRLFKSLAHTFSPLKYTLVSITRHSWSSPNTSDNSAPCAFVLLVWKMLQHKQTTKLTQHGLILVFFSLHCLGNFSQKCPDNRHLLFVDLSNNTKKY